LIKHLKEQGISCWRSTSIADIPLVPATLSTSESIADRARDVVTNFAKRKTARPRTLKTLRTTIAALFGSQLMEDELVQIIEHLTKHEQIKITDGKVQYELPA
jgi:hypothetical protein